MAYYNYIVGIYFICLQMYEYNEASLNITDSVYSSTSFMLTGLHGMHVIVGVIFSSVRFFRLLRNHFLTIIIWGWFLRYDIDIL